MNIPEVVYDEDYFIKKFEAIPDDQWTVGELTSNDGKRHCALGHCGVIVDPARYDFVLTEEAIALQGLIKNVMAINDTGDQSSPKKRILAALKKAKENKAMA